MDIEKLQQTVESVGCTLKCSQQIHESVGCTLNISFRLEIRTTCLILLPDNFPWYGADMSETKRKNSRIVARVVCTDYGCEWKTWSEPAINVCQDKPLGIEMRENDSHDALLLKDFSYEQIAAWLVEKIGEVSEKAKECRKLMIAYQSKEYEV